MLTVLKILGIAVLAVLALVILIVLIVLLVPLRLQAKFRYDGEIRARAHVCWLLRALHAKIEWLKDHGLLRVKLLGLKTVKKQHLGDWGPQPEVPKEEKKKKKASSEEEPAEEKAEDGPEPAPEPQADKPEEAPQEEKKPEKPAEMKAEEKTEGGKEKKKASGKKEEAKTGAPEGEEEWTPTHPIDKLEEKLDVFEEKLDEIQELIYDEKNRKSLRLIGKQLKRIGRHLKPTKFRVEGELGFDDPAKTGKIMGLIYSFYPVLGEHVRIEGNYGEEVMNFRGEIKCRLRLGLFVGVALRLLLDGNLRRKLMKLIRKDKDKDKETEDRKEAAAKAEEEKEAA